MAAAVEVSAPVDQEEATASAAVADDQAQQGVGSAADESAISSEDDDLLRPASEVAEGGLTEAGAEQVAAQSLEESSESKLFSFRLGLSAFWDDNILLDPSGQEESDFVFRPRGGLTLFFGEQSNNWLALSYDAIGGIYLDHDELNYLDHDGRLRGQWRLAQGSVGLNASFAQLNGPDRESGLVFERNSYVAEVFSSHDVGGKSVLTTRLGYRGYYPEIGRSSDQYKGRLGWGYKVTPKTTLGLAGAYLLLQTENASDQTAQHILFTATHEATEKLHFSLDAGVEFRQFEGADAVDDDTAFVFELEASYQLRERTRLGLSGSRSSFSSYSLSNTRRETTAMTAKLEQQIGRRFAFELSGGYEREEYLPTRRSVSSNREDDYWFARAALFYRPTADVSLGIYYEHADNDSSNPNRTYEANRVGMQFNLSF